MRTFILLIVGLASCTTEPVLADGADTAAPAMAEADDLVSLPAERLSEAEAMAIAVDDQEGFKARSTIMGSALREDGSTPLVYAVTLLSVDEATVRLRYVDLVTGELYLDLDEEHYTEASDEAYAWYRNCPGGWLCIRNPPSAIAFYSQRDTAWSRVRLGNSNLTIGSDGCLLTSYAMALREEGFGTRNPADLNTLALQRGCYSGAMLDGACVVRAAGGHHAVIPVNNVWSTLASGRPVVAHGRSDCLGPYTHAQMLWGHDGARFWTKDPWFDYTQQDQSQCLSGIVYRTVD